MEFVSDMCFQENANAHEAVLWRQLPGNGALGSDGAAAKATGVEGGWFAEKPDPKAPGRSAARSHHFTISFHSTFEWLPGSPATSPSGSCS